MRHSIKKLIFVSTFVFVLGACGQEDRLPEEVYQQSINTMDELESVGFDETRSVSAGSESVTVNMSGAAVYSDPLEGYLLSETQMIDLDESLNLHMRTSGDTVEVKEEDQEEWEAMPEVEEPEAYFSNKEEMESFLQYETQFLMKEEEDHFEVSFRGTGDRFSAIMQDKAADTGLLDEDASEEEIEAAVLPDRVEVVAFIDRETHYLSEVQMNYRFQVEVDGERESYNESTTVTYSDYNDIDNPEQYVEDSQ